MKLGNKLVKVGKKDIEGFRVRLTFADKTSGMVSLSSIFEKPRNLTAEILKGGMFEKCFVENGALAWPNGLELCPDMLYELLVKQKKQAA